MDVLIEYILIFLDKYKDALMRGTLILGSLYTLFWIMTPKRFSQYRIKHPKGQLANPKGEIKQILITYIAYSIAGVFVILAKKYYGISAAYLDISECGITYTVLSFLFFCLYSDTTFYWSHYLMHKSKLFYKAHRQHHKFINTTPFAAYAFGIGEAFISASFFMLMILFVPWHPIIFLTYLIYTITYNGIIHSGYDLFPRSWQSNIVMKWFYTPTHHALHHQKHNCNYGFLFTFWDKLMGTEEMVKD